MNPRTLPTASLSLHPEAAIVPEMPPDQYADFLADVKARGIQERVKLIPGTTTIIDGRTRLRAAKEAGIDHLSAEDADLRDESPSLYMFRAALLRRHLTFDQVVALAAVVEEQLAKAAKDRQRAAGGDRRSQKAKDKSDSAPRAKVDSAPLHAAKEAAKQAGVSPRSVAYAKEVKKKAPDIFEKLKAGTVTLAEAKRVVKGDPPAKSPLARVKPSSFAAKPVAAPVALGAGIGQYPLPFLISELEETIAWITERAEVIEGIMPSVAAKPRDLLSVEVARLRGRVTVIRQAINKARDAQWDKEKA